MKHQIFWTEQKILSRLPLITPLVHRRASLIPPFRYLPLPGPLAEAPVGAEVDASGWDEIPFDSYWGDWSQDFVLRSDFTVPEGFGAHGPVALHLPLGVAGDIFCHPEGLAYIDGVSCASADRQHHEIYLDPELCDGARHTLALHGWTGLSGWPPDRNSKQKLFMKPCAVVEIDTPARELVALVTRALDVAGHMEEGNTARGRILRALDLCFKDLDTRDPIRSDAFYDSVPGALAVFRDTLAGYRGEMEVDILAIGHAHIDIAYLWQVDQTRRKCGRSFSNVLALMEEYPDYHFSQSQPVLYEMTAEDYPQVFEGIKSRVAEGRWEPMGGMWVEPDCNLAGGESLVRQLMYGRRYYEEQFGEGAETPVLWLPDTFGFTAALPQLMKQAGMKWFVANKLNWNQYNQMPNQLFWWEGIDGSRVLSHFLTTPSTVQYLPHPTTYKAEMTAREVFGTWENFRQKHLHQELITCFGYGDGGGGPTRELIDAARAYDALPGTPRVRMGKVRDFFERVEAEIAHDLPTWSGEFYLELHRGTLTSQARIKRANRKAEILLHDVEFLASLAGLTTGAEYPAAALEEAWKLVLLNQFHDILPGTSITEVFADAERDYAAVMETGTALREAALTALGPQMPAEAEVMAVNPTGFSVDRIGWIGTTVSGLADLRSGRVLRTQGVEGGTLIDLPALPGYAALGLGRSEEAPESTSLRITEFPDGAVLENDLIRMHVAPNGQLVSIFDKTALREVLAEDAVGNQLLAFEDRPMVWDAWDIDIFYEDRCEVIDAPVRFEITERGPLRASLEVEHRWRGSTITQRICLHHNSKRIEFKTEVDWQASHILLKCAFPVAIFSPRATYDIQFGNTERTTHSNTSWDWARFESVGHKWADLSEGNYGVALLNDCKYGYDIRDNVMRLSLLKSATMPDPEQDQGLHEMTYALLPHEGNWRSDVTESGYVLNNPVLCRPVAGGQGAAPLVQMVGVSGFSTVVETVKQAEDGRGYIVRIFENERTRGPVDLRFGFEVSEVRKVTILEADLGPVPLRDRVATVDLTPYEIVSLRVVPAGA
ncbi:MAG: alpha-mannosidase [Pseudomonadota bacterium]